MDDTAVEEERETEIGPGRAGNGVKDLKGPEDPQRDAVMRVASLPEDTKLADEVDTETAHDATAWLLASFRGELPPQRHTLKVNVGSLTEPHWVRWTVQAIERQVIDKLRDEAVPGMNRAGRRQGVGLTPKESADAQWRLNVKLVVAGTVDPDIRSALAQTAPSPGQPHLASAELFVEEAFRRNSGLVEQIASAILTLSGYDDENVSDELQGKATGNS